jgi:hypothetical protein
LRIAPLLLGAAALWLASGCGEEAPRPRPARAPASDSSPNARPEIVETLRADRAAVRHPSDGGGRARFAWDGEPPPLGAGELARFPLVYEAGPLGIAEGGWLFLQVPPQWGWSAPQTHDPRAPGFTEIASDAEGVQLEPRELGEELGIRVAGRSLAAGETLRITYGAGEIGARVDRFAERGSRFHLAVDGDGDGVRAFLGDAPEVDIGPGAPALLIATLPSAARPGEVVTLRLAFLDRAGNAGIPVEGEVALSAGPGVELAASARFARADAGVRAVALVAREPGVVRVRATAEGGLEAESNPLLVAPEPPRILWGDLHGHSNLSDGTGTPDDYYRYARDVAGLDVAALTDHDHWGVPFLDESPALWREIREAAARFHAPGRFVTLLGFEWTSWLHGHRHVLHFEDDGPLLSSLDAASDDPAELWAALRGRPALTFAHHSAGGPVATNWAFAPDPVLEPVTEVVSVHGSSEAPDAPIPIHAPVAGNFVRDVLARGWRLGFIGSGDSHDGHPGLAQLASPSGGLAAIFAAAPTREAVLAALRARRCYATNGPRIVLEATLAGRPMGERVPPGDQPLRVRVIAPGALERVEVIRGADVAFSARVPPGEEQREAALDEPLRELRPGEFVYLRAVQRDGGAAWSSPFFVDAEAAPLARGSHEER